MATGLQVEEDGLEKQTMKLNMIIFFGVAYFFSAFFASVVFADDGQLGTLSVQINKSNQVILTGPESVVTSEFLELQNLKFRFDEDSVCRPNIGCEGETCKVNVSSCFPKTYEGAIGKKFEVPGPNCFGTALKLSGFYPTFRGVDTGEFTSYVKLACKAVDEPLTGDIGVFEAPRYGFVHAYIYLSASVGIDKPGVDYSGKTAIRVRPLADIEYSFLASKECRQSGKDSRSCYNQHYYLRCEKLDLSKYSEVTQHSEKVLEIEKTMEELIEKSKFSSEDIKRVFEVETEIHNLKYAFESNEGSKSLDADLIKYLKEQMKSLGLQADFLVRKVRSL